MVSPERNLEFPKLDQYAKLHKPRHLKKMDSALDNA